MSLFRSRHLVREREMANHNQNKTPFASFPLCSVYLRAQSGINSPTEEVKILIVFTGSSLVRQPISFSSPGSTIISMALVDGTCSPMGTQFVIFPTFSRTGYVGWSIRCKDQDQEAVTRLFKLTS